MCGVLAAAVLAMLIPAWAEAHVTIAPQQSMAGATEKYVIRVPTEGKVATVAAELDVPDGVVVEVVSVPNGWKYELKRQGDRIVGITWTMNTPQVSSRNSHLWRAIRATRPSWCGVCASDLATVRSPISRKARTGSGQRR
jgi:uncharacterized protein YcnI